MDAIKIGLVRLIQRIIQCMPNSVKFILRPFSRQLFSAFNSVCSSVKKDKLVKTAKGPYIYINYGYGVERNIASGMYESRYVDFFCSVIKGGDVVIDVGAYIGYFSLLAAKIVGDDGFVYLFEPIPQNFQRILKNLEVNQANNVKAYNLGLSDREEILSFSVPWEIPAESSLAGSWVELKSNAKLTKDLIEAKLVPLDQFCKNIGLHKIDVIKVDVEGSELKVLKGMRHLLTDSSTTWLFLEITEPLIRLLSGSVVELIRLLVSYGFKKLVLVDLDLEIEISNIGDDDVMAIFGGESRNCVLHKGG